MGKALLKKAQVFGLAFLFIAILNIIIRVSFGYQALPKYFLMDYFIIAIMLFPLFVVNNRLYTLIYSSFIVFIFVALFIVNETYYINLGILKLHYFHFYGII